MTAELWIPHRTNGGYYVPAFSRVENGKLDVVMNMDDMGTDMSETECAAICTKRNREQMARVVAKIERLTAELDAAHEELADIEAAFRTAKIEV